MNVYLVNIDISIMYEMYSNDCMPIINAYLRYVKLKA